MIRQIISRKLPTGFKLPTLVVAIFATFMAPLEANINVPPDAALKIDGGHVVVNDDDTNPNEIWDKSEIGFEEVIMENLGLEGPKTSAKPEPVLRQFSFKAKWTGSPGILVITPLIPDANIKLWKDDRRMEPFTLAETYIVISAARNTITFWVEGIEPTESFDSIKFTAVYTFTKPASGLSATATGTIAFGVTQTDLDIDSDNQSGTNATGYDEDEDRIEFSFKEEHPGKIILETRNDVDSDGVIDSVDGISELLGTSGTPTVAGLKLTPMRLTLKKPFTTATAKVKFSYRASVPRIGGGIEANGQDTAGNTLYRITTPGIRLWTKNGDARTSGKDVGGTDSGDFIPADTEINWEDLFELDSEVSTEKIIYVEYVDVAGSDKQFSKEDIVVEISDDTSATKGYIQYNEGEKKPLLGTKSPDGVNATLLPVDIIPDYNRDGKIDGNDRGKVTKGNPYRFWVNDDDDMADEYRNKDGKDIPNLLENDSTDQGVDGIRDLVDFFPLHLDLRSALKVFPKEDGYTYYLSHSESAFNFLQYLGAILDDPTSSHSLNAYLRQSNIAEIFKNSTLSDTEGRDNLYHSFLDSLESGQGVVLLEAIKKTTKPIVLEIRKHPTSEAIVKYEFHVETSSVEDMYRHINLRSASGGSGGRETDISEPKNYPDDMPELASDKYFVLVHGYNVNGEQARGWHAEFFKRMWWSGSKAKFIGVSWQGEESQGGAGMTSPVADIIPDTMTPNYHANVINAFQTADNLAIALNQINGRKCIAAHSLGNIVVGLAIQDHDLEVENYYLIDAAVAMEAYDADESKKDGMTNADWVNYDEKLWATEWHKLPWTENDARRKLTWRGRLDKVAARPFAYNFYSSEEEILNNSTLDHRSNFIGVLADDLIWDSIIGGNVLGERTWVLQEILKGNGWSGEILGSTYGGWKFNDFESPSGYYKMRPEFGTVGYRKYNPLEAAALTEQELMNNPFFHLYSVNDFTAELLHAELLAEAFPARTNPAGRNPVDVFIEEGGDNFDMVGLKNNWFSNDTNDRRWLHSDIRDVAYLYTYKVYEKFTELGELDE